jgi:hypothetical protein
MADGTVDTSIYPKANQNSLLDTLGTVASIKNANETNKLLKQQQVQGQIGIDQSKIDQAHKMYDGFIGLLGSVAQDPRVGTADGPAVIQNYANQAVKLGYITPEARDQAMATMPQDPAQIPQWLQTMNMQALAGQERWGQIYGSPQFVNDGSSIIPVTVSPITGVRPIGAPIQQTLTPQDRGTLVETKDEQGRTVLRPKGNLLSAAGVDPMTAQPQQQNRLVPAPAPVERGPALAPPSANPAGGVVTSPPAGQVEAQTKTAAAGAEQFGQDVARERNYQADILPLEKARDALISLGTTGTGPGTEQLNEVKSFLTSMGIVGPDEDVKNFDEARKYLVQYARGAGDTGTNDKLAAAFAGNPSLGISNAASVDVVKTAISLRRLQNAQVRAFSSSQQSPAEYSKWSTEFNATQDPVAYGFDMMDGAQRLKYFKGLSGEEKNKFLTSLKTAQQLGVIAPPSAAPAKNEVPNGG